MIYGAALLLAARSGHVAKPVKTHKHTESNKSRHSEWADSAYFWSEMINFTCQWSRISLSTNNLSSNRFISISWKIFIHSVRFLHLCRISASTEKISCAKSKESDSLLFSVGLYSDVSKMFSAIFPSWLCQPVPSHKYTSFQFTFLGLFIKIDPFVQDYTHSWLQCCHLAFLWGVYLNVSTIRFAALPLRLLKLPLVHLVAGRHPKYSEVQSQYEPNHFLIPVLKI